MDSRESYHAIVFMNSTLFHVCFPSFLRLIRISMARHSLQWSTTFEILVASLRLETDVLDPMKALALKGEILQSMVLMICAGYIFPVLTFVKQSIRDLDQALLRNFVSNLMWKNGMEWILK